MKTAANMISVLGLFSLERSEWSVDDAAQELQLGRSTTYRYFKVLADAGLVIAYRPGCYILGPAIMELDRQTRLLDPLIAAARGKTQDALDVLPKPSVILLCRLLRDEVICVHQEPETVPGLAVSYERGKLMPLYRGAASKIILAHLPARFVKAYCARHGTEMAEAGLGADWEEVRAPLRGLRSEGVSVTRGDLGPGLIEIAAPLLDADGNIIGSMGAAMRDDLGQVGLQSACSAIKTLAQLINAEFVTHLLEE